MINTAYYPLLFILSISWRTYYRPSGGAAAAFSYIAMQSAIFSMLQFACSMTGSEKLRLVLAGGAAVWVFLVHLNSLLLSITSMTLYESIKVLATGGDFLYTLEEAGLGIPFMAALVFILSLIFCGGAASMAFMPGINLPATAVSEVSAYISVMCVLFFAVEQILNRNSENFFSRRNLPMYIELFSTNRDSVTFTIPERIDAGGDKFSAVTAPGKPGDVVVIILESFRRDSVDQDLAPDMKALAEDSPVFPGYHTDAIYTSLAWNTILMDRPPMTLSDDIRHDRLHGRGSPVFRIFREAGYRTYVASSANMEWKNFHRRIEGREGLIDSYFCAYREREEERNIIDHRTCERAVSWIKAHDSSIPLFMVVQMDSSHWTYYSDENNRLSRPYAGAKVNIAKLRNPDDIDLLFNRYRNSVRQINSSVSLIVNALKEKGTYDRTALVIVSDHGEGFSTGMIGHSVMHDEIKRPAFIMRLPGVKKFTHEGFMSHMDIFPTLFHHMGIRGTEGIMKGISVLDKGRGRKGLLCFHGSLLMADLTFDDYTMFFRIKKRGRRVTFTPVRSTDRQGKMTCPADREEWKAALSGIIENYA